MKIITPGNKKAVIQTRRFSCQTCSCVFECDKGEYKLGSQYNESYHYAMCPECGGYANEIELPVKCPIFKSKG